MNFALIKKIFHYDVSGNERLQRTFTGSRGNLMVYRFLAWTSFFIYVSELIGIAAFSAFILNNSLIHNPDNGLRNVIFSFAIVFLLALPVTVAFVQLIFKYTIHLTKPKGITKH